jgi:putative ABC transport system ATP-binding protein
VRASPSPQLAPGATSTTGAARGTRIDLDDVSKRYRIGEVGVDALVGVDLHVADNAFVVILGPSGSGKTTLLNMIGLLDTPSSGRIRLAGRDVTDATRGERSRLRRHTVSFVFQSFNLFPGLTAVENVRFGAEVAGPRAPCRRGHRAAPRGADRLQRDQHRHRRARPAERHDDRLRPPAARRARRGGGRDGGGSV